MKKGKLYRRIDKMNIPRFRVMVIRTFGYRPRHIFDVPGQGEIVSVSDPMECGQAVGEATGYNSAAAPLGRLWAVISYSPFHSPIKKHIPAKSREIA